MDDLLRVRDLRVRFALPEGEITAVDGVSFRVPPGGTVALVGESGSGKSVIAQSILRILPPAARIAGGEILLADPARPDDAPVDLAALDGDSRAMRMIRGDRIAIVFQEPMSSFSPLHTIGDQIGEALRIHRKTCDWRARVVEMLRLVGFPDPARAVNAYPFELSGGLRQRAMIAMALICRPALLIADEPTTALDVTIQAQILKLLKDLQRELGMAVLMITHDLGVVANVADEIVVIHRGRVMERGTLDHIFRDPRHPYLKALLRAVPRLGRAPGERLVPVRAATPCDPALLARRRAAAKPADDDRPLLVVKGLRKTFAARRRKGGGAAVAVDDVSFEIRRGECLGLVGESGCGKTTLSKMLMRALEPDRGEIAFCSEGRPCDVLELSGAALLAYRRKVQLVFQDPFGALDPRMTVFDIIAEPLEIHRIGDAAQRAATVKELMRLVGLDLRYLRRYPHSFSGGQRQRIVIARALALAPELLICDEPVSALDVSIQAQILNLLKDLKDALDLTYLFVSHNLAVVDYMADRIAVMCAGRLVEIAPRERLFADARHPYTRALLAAVPEPDPDRPLDFDAIAEDRASDPAAWPAPFALAPEESGALVALGEGHFLRVSDRAAGLEPGALRRAAS